MACNNYSIPTVPTFFSFQLPHKMRFINILILIFFFINFQLDISFLEEVEWSKKMSLW